MKKLIESIHAWVLILTTLGCAAAVWLALRLEKCSKVPAIGWFALPWVIAALVFIGFLVFQIHAEAAGDQNRWGDHLPYEFNVNKDISLEVARVLAQMYDVSDQNPVILLLLDPVSGAYRLAVAVPVTTVEETAGKQVISRVFQPLDRFGNHDNSPVEVVKVVTEAEIQAYFNYQEV
jgi:hypothetical protein